MVRLGNCLDTLSNNFPMKNVQMKWKTFSKRKVQRGFFLLLVRMNTGNIFSKNPLFTVVNWRYYRHFIMFRFPYTPDYVRPYIIVMSIYLFIRTWCTYRKCNKTYFQGMYRYIWYLTWDSNNWEEGNIYSRQIKFHSESKLGAIMYIGEIFLWNPIERI